MVIYKKVTTGNINVSTVVTVTVAGVAKVMEPKLNSLLWCCQRLCYLQKVI